MNQPIIALDVQNKEEAQQLLNQLPKKLFVKVGMELFYHEGPSIVEWLIQEGYQVFLDLKLHDIPNTVEHAMYQLGKLGVAMTNVHAAGGKRMMEAAKRGLIQGARDNQQPVPTLIAVTQLTSTSEEEMQHDQGMTMSLENSVKHYAKLTQEAGLDGVVCSAHEAAMIQSLNGKDFETVCPGIRLAENDRGDQRRVMTPKAAKEAKATYIVVGRSITQAQNPSKAYQQLIEEWGE